MFGTVWAILVELDEETDYNMEVIIDKVIVDRDVFKPLSKTIENSLKLIGEGYIRFEITGHPSGKTVDTDSVLPRFCLFGASSNDGRAPAKLLLIQ